jgi:hypothetical protein
LFSARQGILEFHYGTVFAAAVVVGWMIYWPLKIWPRPGQNARTKLIFLFAGMMVPGYFVARFGRDAVNALLDRGESIERRVEVERFYSKYLTSGKRSYFVEFKSWDPGHRITLPLHHIYSDYDFTAVSGSRSMTVWVKPGFLGKPWVSDYRFESE